MITLSKVSETTKSKARDFKAKIVEDLAIKIKSHCYMLGISEPTVKVFEDNGDFEFVRLDVFITRINVNNIEVLDLNRLRTAEKHYLHKVLEIKTSHEVSYETYIAQEAAKYVQYKASVNFDQ